MIVLLRGCSTYLNLPEYIQSIQTIKFHHWLLNSPNITGLLTATNALPLKELGSLAPFITHYGPSGIAGQWMIITKQHGSFEQDSQPNKHKFVPTVILCCSVASVLSFTTCAFIMAHIRFQPSVKVFFSVGCNARQSKFSGVNFLRRMLFQMSENMGTFWLVVSAQLKRFSQNGKPSPSRGENKQIFETTT